MHWIIAQAVKYGLTTLTRYIIMKTIKAFIKSRKGKAILISLVLGVTGYNLPPEAVEAIITLSSALGY
jgi:hypothetical protein